VKQLNEQMHKPSFKSIVNNTDKMSKFMESLRKCIDDTIELKLNMNMSNYTETEEEELLINVLTSLSNNKILPHERRNTAGDWLNELYRPSRKRDKNDKSSAKDKKVMKLINNINKSKPKEDL